MKRAKGTTKMPRVLSFRFTKSFGAFTSEGTRGYVVKIDPKFETVLLALDGPSRRPSMDLRWNDFINAVIFDDREEEGLYL